jgi:hypothetical protein
MSDLFISIYSGGGGMKFMKHFKGAQGIKVLERLVYTLWMVVTHI